MGARLRLRRVRVNYGPDKAACSVVLDVGSRSLNLGDSSLVAALCSRSLTDELAPTRIGNRADQPAEFAVRDSTRERRR
jgi:hypothetical protein